MTLPLVSIVVSSYNRPKLIRDAIDSVLAQTWPQDRLQILVCDDWSNIETSRVIGDYIETRSNIAMVRPASVPTDAERQYGSRCAIAINAAMPLVRGEFVAFLPDDDLAAPRSIESRARYLMEHPDCNVVVGRLEACKAETPIAGFHWMGELAAFYDNSAGCVMSHSQYGDHAPSLLYCEHDRNGWWPKDGPVARIANKADHSMPMVRVQPHGADCGCGIHLPRWPESTLVNGERFDCPDAAWFAMLENGGFGPFHGIDEIAVIKRYHSRHHRTDPSKRE